MFIEQLGLQHVLREAWDDTGSDTTVMTKDDRIVFVDSTLGAGYVYLPPVAECIGLWYAVVCSTYSGAFVIEPHHGGQATADSVFYENEGELAGGTSTAYTITATNGWALFLSLGDRWLIIANDPDAG
jgi:hypothetical protein